MKRSTLFFAWALACTGCTTFSLNQHTLAQIRSNEEIRRQEALANLALVANDHSALPAYSSIFSGTAQVQDTTTFDPAGSFLTWGIGATGMKDGFTSLVATPSLSRQVSENWTLDPIVVPEKIEAVRAVCKRALNIPLDEHEVSLLARPDEFELSGLLSLRNLEQPGKPNELEFRDHPQERHFGGVGAKSPNGTGIKERLDRMGDGWVHCGHKDEAPHNACFKAHHGKTCIWILPQDADKLSSLIILIQDIARVDSNNATLYCATPSPALLSFEAQRWELSDPYATPPNNRSLFRVIATVAVDPWMNLVPDSPYRIIRVDNTGSQSNLRSQIAAATISP